jgi:predicted TIM-barrel fold metal-dependent hydrolase
MIIDLNMHWHSPDLFKDKSLLKRYLRCFPRGYDDMQIELKTLPGTNKPQMVVSQPRGYENLNTTEVTIDPKGLIEAMNQAGVDKGIIRPCCWQGWFDFETSKIINDLMAKTVSENPDRLLALASVPPWDDEDAFYELERCIKELGFVGVLCASHYRNLYLDHAELKPYFKKLNSLGVPVCIHHTPLPVEHKYLYEYTNVRRSFGRCIEQMTSVGRVLFSGMLEEFPNLTLIFTMMAGGLFAFTNQIAPPTSGVKEEMNRFEEVGDTVRKYLKNNIYFDLSTPQSWTKAQLECAVKEFGADHILFASSYPTRLEWLVKGPEYLRKLNITEKEKELILGGNAQRLFKIKG